VALAASTADGLALRKGLVNLVTAMGQFPGPNYLAHSPTTHYSQTSGPATRINLEAQRLNHRLRPSRGEDDREGVPAQHSRPVLTEQPARPRRPAGHQGMLGGIHHKDVLHLLLFSILPEWGRRKRRRWSSCDFQVR
jgi:hypothetical protein